MVVADRAEGDGQRLQDVGRVVEAADAALDDGDLDVLLGERQQRERKPGLERRRLAQLRPLGVQPLDGRTDGAHQPAPTVLGATSCAVDAGALAPAHQVRRGDQARSEARPRAGSTRSRPRSSPCPWSRPPGTLGELAVRTAETIEERPHPRELARMVGHDLGRRADVRREAVQPAQRVLVVRVGDRRNLAASR